MKFGICLNMATKDPAKIGTDLLDDIVKSGYDYVEVSVQNTMPLDRETFRDKVLEPVRASGLPCLTMNAFCGPNQSFLGEENQKKAIEYTKEAVERANMLGAKVIVIGSGAARCKVPGQDYAEAAKQMVPFFQKAADIAKDAGIELALEGLNRQETNMFVTLDQAMEEAAFVAKENFGVLVDYFHFTLGNEDPSAITQVAGQIRHVHIARMVGRIIPQVLEEDPGYVTFLRALSKGGYDRTLSIEANCPGDFSKAAPAGLEVIRKAWQEALA